MEKMEITTTHTGEPALIVWDDYSANAKLPLSYYTPMPKATVTFSANTRVNKPTLVSKPLPEVMATVKVKLLKQLFEQLEQSKLVKITTSTSPTGAVTFHASLELVQPNDETTKAP
jgi:hypothetical protein